MRQNLGLSVSRNGRNLRMNFPAAALRLGELDMGEIIDHYKDLTWVRDADRKFRPSGSLFGITRLSIRTEHSCLILFSCISFGFEFLL